MTVQDALTVLSKKHRLPPKCNLVFLMSSLIAEGSEIKISKLANYLSRRGWSVEVAYLNLPDDLAGDFPKSVSLTCLNRQSRLDIATIIRLRQFLLARRPAIVVSVNLFPVLYLFLSGCLGTVRSLPNIVLINQMGYRKGIGGRIRALFYSVVLRIPATLVFGAKCQRDLWEQAYGLSKKKATVIYNGVDTEWFSATAISQSRSKTRASMGLSPSDFVLITVAGLRPVKNLSLLLNALQELCRDYPHIKAVLVGDGPEKFRLEKQSRELGIDHVVQFAGKVRDVRPMLAASNLFALTSETETFSNAALEAMSMGKAVILPDKGGSAEMVNDCVNGWLFTPGCTASFVELVRRAVRNPVECERMGAAARQAVLERFPLRNMLDEYECMFHNVQTTLD